VRLVYNVLKKTRKATVIMRPMSGYADYSKFSISIGQQKSEHLINSTSGLITLNAELPPGETRIRMHSFAERVDSKTDSRELFFRLGAFKLTEDPNAILK